MTEYVLTVKVPASATTFGFVPPTLNTNDSGVVEPLVNADDKALVKVMTLLVTVQPPGLEVMSPVVNERVHDAWSVNVIEDGNVMSISLLTGILWVGRIVTLYYVVP